MRPITKKNAPYNNSLKELDENPANNQDITDLIAEIGDPSFVETVKNLVNLTDNTYVSSLIEKKRNDIRQMLNALNIPYVQNFHTHFVITNFKNVDITREITPLLDIYSPNPDTITKVLTNAAGIRNNLDILTAPYNVALQTIKNISTLLVLDRLIDAGHIRNLYKDARYNEINNPDKTIKSQEYGASKPHLVKLSGLYCAYCESTLSDGGSTNVEHKIPKSAFPTMEENWSNFVLACERCNTGFKSNRYVHPEGTIEIDRITVTNPTTGKNTSKAYPFESACKYPETTVAFVTYTQQFKTLLTKVSTNITDSKNKNSIIRARRNKIITPEEDLRKDATTRAIAEVDLLFIAELKTTKNIEIFCGGAMYVNNVKEDIARIAIYNSMVQYAIDKIIWPDKSYTGEGIKLNQCLSSFMAFNYGLMHSNGNITTPINLKNITPDTDLQINDLYQMDVVNLTGILPVFDVQVRILIPDYKQKAFKMIVSDADKVASSGKNMISITGLNNGHVKDIFLDQRIMRRTKAWLHAMKMLKQLTEFNMQKFERLHNYYQEQLHPANIKYNLTLPVRNNIAGLRDNTTAPILLDDITGNITINKIQADGEINLKLDTKTFVKTGTGANRIKIKGTFIPSVDVKLGTLTGEIVDSGGIRTMTGSLEVGTITGNTLSQKIILFKNATINNGKSGTVITIAVNQGVISDDANLGTTSSAAEILKEWNNNRSQLLGVINQTTAILKDFMWENILDMVRTGGFYSTWINTFVKSSSKSAPYDVDLVRKLEMKALETPEDPYQFHGTDVVDIINCI